nr:acyltransferase [Allonocardiopsis opalescens]
MWGRLHGHITAQTSQGRAFGAFGEHSSIAFPYGTLFGERWIALGSSVMIGAEATLSAGMVPGLDLGPEPLLRIADGSTIGRGSHIVAHESIEIGENVYTGPYIYITDQNHAYVDPDTPIGKQWPVNEPVRIGSGSWIGANAVILPGTVLGRNCVVAAGSVVRGVYGDHCVLAGVPARVVRRYEPGTGWQPPLRGPQALRAQDPAGPPVAALAAEQELVDGVPGGEPPEGD